MDRNAVAATIASVLVFTAMLLANAAIYSAQNSYLSAITLSSAQSQERDYASVLFAVSSYSSLAKTQYLLETTPMDCSYSQSYLGSLSGSEDGAASNQSVWYSFRSSWGYVSGASTVQNDALLPSQFEGYAQGDLNLQVVTALNESFAGGLPSYSVQRVELVHLSIQPQSMASQCLSALAELRGDLLAARSCSPSAIDAAVTLARTSSSGLGVFDADASTSTVAGRCVVDYSVTVTQTGIQGVSGTFQWTVYGSGSLST